MADLSSAIPALSPRQSRRRLQSPPPALKLPFPILQHLTAPTLRQLARCLQKDSAAKEWRHLVPIQAKGNRPPLYCFHAAGANVLFYRDLARHLGAEQPVYGLQARETPETGAYLDSVEAM